MITVCKNLTAFRGKISVQLLHLLYMQQFELTQKVNIISIESKHLSIISVWSSTEILPVIFLYFLKYSFCFK